MNEILKEFTPEKYYPLSLQTYHVNDNLIFEKWGKYIDTNPCTNKASFKRGFKTTKENKKCGIIGQLSVHQLNVSLGIPIHEDKQICLIDQDENDGYLKVNGGTPLQVKTKLFYKIFSPDCTLMIPIDQYKKYEKSTLFFACVYQPDINLSTIIGYIPYDEFNEKKKIAYPGNILRDGFKTKPPTSYYVYYSDLHNSQKEYKQFILKSDN